MRLPVFTTKKVAKKFPSPRLCRGGGLFESQRDQRIAVDIRNQHAQNAALCPIHSRQRVAAIDAERYAVVNGGPWCRRQLVHAAAEHLAEQACVVRTAIGEPRSRPVVEETHVATFDEIVHFAQIEYVHVETEMLSGEKTLQFHRIASTQSQRQLRAAVGIEISSHLRSPRIPAGFIAP